MWKESRELHANAARNISPFKLALADHFKSKQLLPSTLDPQLQIELSLLEEISVKSVAGIITTNYDNLLELLFKKFKVFIGQEELLFSSPQNVAEIYKIHGCCTRPETIVINSTDYQDFHKRNAYLAAKLMTIFVEHPIIFIGYSLTDSDIEEILKAIIDCLSQNNLSILKNRMIFIEYDKDLDFPTISTHDKSFAGGKIISMTKITTKDFSVIFNAMLKNQSKYPTSVLRRIKNDIYRLVLTNDPKGNLYVKELEDIRETDNIDIVAGVGIIREMGEKGYSIIPVEDLFKDVILNDQKFNHALIVERTLPRLLPIHSNSVPIYKYIKGIPADRIPEAVKPRIKHSFDDFISSNFRKKRCRIQQHSVSEIVRAIPFPKSLDEIACLPENEIDVEELGRFLSELMETNPDILHHPNQNIRTSFKRLVKIYDWLKYY